MRILKVKEAGMLPGETNPFMLLHGLLLLLREELDLEELTPHVLIGRWISRKVSGLYHLLWGYRSDIRGQIAALSNANDVLEARVMELERQLATLPSQHNTVTTQ